MKPWFFFFFFWSNISRQNGDLHRNWDLGRETFVHGSGVGAHPSPNLSSLPRTVEKELPEDNRNPGDVGMRTLIYPERRMGGFPNPKVQSIPNSR